MPGFDCIWEVYQLHDGTHYPPSLLRRYMGSALVFLENQIAIAAEQPGIDPAKVSALEMVLAEASGFARALQLSREGPSREQYDQFLRHTKQALEPHRDAARL